MKPRSTTLAALGAVAAPSLVLLFWFEGSRALGRQIGIPGISRMLLAAEAQLAVVVVLLFPCAIAFRLLVPRWWSHVARGATLSGLLVAGLLIADVAVMRWFVDWSYERYRPLLSHATTWSSSFDEDKFRTVATEMSDAWVLDALGQPLTRSTLGDKEVWFYSEIGQYATVDQKGFHQRALVFAKGRVVRILRRYLCADDKVLRR